MFVLSFGVSPWVLENAGAERYTRAQEMEENMFRNIQTHPKFHAQRDARLRIGVPNTHHDLFCDYNFARHNCTWANMN